MDLPALDPRVRPLGAYLPLDADGYFVNTTRVDAVPPPFRPALDAALRTYEAVLGADLRAVYLRGSAARGNAVLGISDLDTLAFTRERPTPDQADALTRAMETLAPHHPEVRGIELIAFDAASLHSPRGRLTLGFMLATQAVRLRGEDLTAALPRYRPSAEIARCGIDRVRHAVDDALRALSGGPDRRTVHEYTVWICKNLLRVGMCLVMAQQGRYTRDLYPCYEAFVAAHPDRAPQMAQALTWALFPPDEAAPVVAWLLPFGAWMAQTCAAWTPPPGDP